MTHGQDRCEVSVAIPINSTESWMATIIGVELDETVEKTAQVTPTSLCESCITGTATMPIALFLICNQRKAEFINSNFCIQSFWGGHDEIVCLCILASSRIP
jgi:hypothetical protein